MDRQPSFQKQNTLSVDTTEEISMLTKIERCLTDHGVRVQIQRFFDEKKGLFEELHLESEGNAEGQNKETEHKCFTAFQEFKSIIDGKLEEALKSVDCTQEDFEKECAAVMDQPQEGYEHLFLKMIIHSSSDYEGFISDMRTKAALSPQACGY